MDKPKWVGRIVEDPAWWNLSRGMITIVFWAGAISSVAGFQESLDQFNSIGLHPAALYSVVLIAFLLLGSTMILLDRLLWLAAGAFGVFLLLTILFVHPFWTFSGPKRLEELQADFEHLSLIGGLMLLPIAQSFRRQAMGHVSTQNLSLSTGGMEVDRPEQK